MNGAEVGQERASGRQRVTMGSITLPSKGRQANVVRHTQPARLPSTAGNINGVGTQSGVKVEREGQASRGNALVTREPSSWRPQKPPTERTTSVVFGDDVDVSELTDILGRLRVVANPDTRGHLSSSREKGTKTLPPSARRRRERNSAQAEAAGPATAPNNPTAGTSRGTGKAGEPVAGTSSENAESSIRSSGTKELAPDSSSFTLPKSQKQRGKTMYAIRRLDPGLVDRASALLGYVTLERKSKQAGRVTQNENITSEVDGRDFLSNIQVRQRVYELETGLDTEQPRATDTRDATERTNAVENQDIEKRMSFAAEGEDGGPAADEAAESWNVDSVEALLCGCCYIELLDNMVQCAEGHLFCVDCLRGYAQEVVYGQARPPLWCMTEDCDVTFPHSQIQRALSEDELVHYEQRLQTEAILMAGLLNQIIRCPHCDFPVLPDAQLEIFRCPECRHKSCRHCRESWKIHEGLTCEQVEQNDETKVRLTYEERMTKATVRICPKCQASFTKSEGCNLMKCRCGAVMCYICRKPDIDYQHFCKHAHDPGMGCSKCNACYLWTNPKEDEQRAINELKQEAKEERKRLGYTKRRVIGVPNNEDEQTERKAKEKEGGDGEDSEDSDDIMVQENFSSEDSDSTEYSDSDFDSGD